MEALRTPRGRSGELRLLAWAGLAGAGREAGNEMRNGSKIQEEKNFGGNTTV